MFKYLKKYFFIEKRVISQISGDSLHSLIQNICFALNKLIKLFLAD